MQECVVAGQYRAVVWCGPPAEELQKSCTLQVGYMLSPRHCKKSGGGFFVVAQLKWREYFQHITGLSGLNGVCQGDCGKLESLGREGVGLFTQFLCCAQSPTTAKT
jgi:hypothetical protein